MLRRMLITGLAAGVAAGLLITLVQQIRVAPLIAEAERYELAGLAEKPAAGNSRNSARDGFRDSPLGRLMVTAAVNMLIAVGFGLLLAAAFSLHGREPSLARGMVWGVAGYVVFVAAPALGLPPELPGTPAAGVQARQIWWLGTVAAALVGLCLIFLTHRLWLRFLGGFLATLPHALGAPHPPELAPPPYPEGLGTEFVLASLATSLIFWLLLGAFSGWLYRRLG